jgi:DNA-binding FadR family transcriptional regulator
MPAAKNIFTSIKSERISKLVEDKIREAICDNHFKVGERIPSVREFSETFGVSRSTVQQALRSLERSGLIIIKKGAKGGSYVMKGDTTSVVDSLKDLMHLKQISLRDIAEVRLMLEPIICALAVDKISTEDIERLEEWNQKLAVAFRSGNPKVENNPTMHTLIAQTLGNPLLTIFMKTLMEIHSYKMSNVTLSKKIKTEIVDQHKQIIEALKKRQKVDASERMQEHIRSVLDYLRSLEQTPGGESE